MPRPGLIQLLFGIFFSSAVSFATADDVQVAAATNFSIPLQQIATAFHQDTGHTVKIVLGSSGKLYAQIIHGAPYAVFLSADTDKPIRLEQQGLIAPGSRFTYAIGKLVLWSNRTGYIDDHGQVLQHGNFRHLAIANPTLAPYGQAALDVLTNLKLLEKLHTRLVQGEDIAQAYQFVATGNAELGFVALSQVTQAGKLIQGSAWIVPTKLYQPIHQAGVLLLPSQNNPAAVAFCHYLRSDKAKTLIRRYGYDI